VDCQWGRKPPKFPLPLDQTEDRYTIHRLQWIVSGEENLQNFPFPLTFCQPPKEDGATAIGNIHKNGQDCACGSGDMLADRPTHRQTHRRAHYNTAPPLPRAK